MRLQPSLWLVVAGSVVASSAWSVVRATLGMSEMVGWVAQGLWAYYVQHRLVLSSR